jgi:DNA-binding transcriptional regulator YiaG
LCGGGVAISWTRHTFDYGSGESAVELSVEVPVHRCDGCDFEFTDEIAERLRHEAVCDHLGVLSPAQIRRIRERHGMTRAQFARVTGLGEASLNRWENGLNIQTHANDRYLRLLEIPEVMRLLVGLVDSRTSRRSSAALTETRFRELRVTTAMLREQESFRLCRAA